MSSLQLSQQEAAKELLRRRRARQNLVDFARYTNRSYIPAYHHFQICQKLEAVANGEIKRLMIFMPPRHGKSELASRRFPAWFMGRFPERSIIAASYNSELAGDFGRDVRNIVDSAEYKSLFSTRLASDSKAAGRWHTDQDGGYVAAGVGTAITGRGAHILLVDDPFKDRESADSEIMREKTYKWFLSTAYTRLEGSIAEEATDPLWREFKQEIVTGDAKPFEGAIVIIQCMTGDTPVLMADGSEKRLDALKSGDIVSTYDNGNLRSSKVINHKSNGVDSVYRIKTTSGKVVRANARHPFLVFDHGELKWIRTKDLKSAQKIVTVKGNGANGKAKSVAQKGVSALLDVADFVVPTIKRLCGLAGIDRRPATKIHHQESAPNLSTVMALPLMTTREYLLSRVASAPFVKPSRKTQETLNTGTTFFVSTIAMIMERFAGFFATIATLFSREEQQLKHYETQSFTCERVISVELDGKEEVFDVQIERTENFIANGLVSHNTRWHEDDLAGRLLEDMKNGADQYEVLSLPAINDRGEALWPAKYPIERLTDIKKALSQVSERDWQSLYQQDPKPDDGTYFKREWFHRFNLGEEPKVNKYQSTDFAVTDGSGDFTELGIIGLCGNMDIWALDWWYGQTTSDIWVDQQLEQIRKHNPLATFGETGVIRRAVEPLVRMMSQQKRVYPRLEWITRTGDKAAMARAFQGTAAAGKVHIPRCDWGDRLLNQLVAFPAGTFDDAVDVMALFGMAIQMAHPAIMGVKKDTRETDLWGRYKSGGDSWKTA